MQKEKKKAKLPELTKQDIAFVEKVATTGKLSKSVQEAYGIENQRYAGVKAQRLITKDNIIEAIEVKRKSLKQALLDEGIDEDYLAKKVNVLLKATDKDGNPDVNAIDKGLKHSTNIYGITDSDDKPKVNSTYNFIFNAETQQNVKEINEIIKAKLINPDESI